jgi:hypothetical protein
MSDPSIAILIIGHANPGVFQRLARSLDHPAIAVFCHIDAKSDLTRFSADVPGNLVFIEDRKSVFWGGYRMIEAELALFRAARQAGPFAAYALISGDSLPLIDNDALVDVFTQTPHTLRFREQVPGDKSYERIERVYLPDTAVGTFRGLPTHLDRHLTSEDFVMFRRAMRSRRLKRSRKFLLFKGAPWFSVRDDLLGRMLAHLEADASYEEIFRFSANPDELFFHTLLKIVEPAAESAFGIMGMDWTRKPMPGIMRSDDDLPMIAAATEPFFRKFSDHCLSLVDKVIEGRLNAAQIIAREEGPIYPILRVLEDARDRAKPADVPAEAEGISELQ